MAWIIPNQGKDIEIRSTDAYLQYRYVGSIDWQNFLLIEDIAGEPSNSLTTASLTIPAADSTVTIAVERTGFVVIGSTVLVRGVDGTFHGEITNLDPVAKTLTIKALGYSGDDTGTLATGAKIVPTGKIGPEGNTPLDSIRIPLIIPSPMVGGIAILAPFESGATLSAIVHKTVSGTATITAKIDGVDVAGVTAVSVGSTKTTTNATGSNQLTSNQDLTLSITSISSPVDFSLTFVFTNIL